MAAVRLCYADRDDQQGPVAQYWPISSVEVWVASHQHRGTTDLKRHIEFTDQETHKWAATKAGEQRQSIYHASLVVQALLEVPEPVLPEVVGTLAEEWCQLGVIQALNVRMTALTKHGPHILVLQLPVHLTRLRVMQDNG